MQVKSGNKSHGDSAAIIHKIKWKGCQDTQVWLGWVGIWVELLSSSYGDNYSQYTKNENINKTDKQIYPSHLISYLNISGKTNKSI